MPCPKCSYNFGHSEDYPAPEVCPRCGVVFRKLAKTKAEIAKAAIAKNGGFAKPTIVAPIDPFSRPKRNFSFAYFIVAAAIGFCGYKVVRHARHAPISRKFEREGDPCYGKEKCIVVYVAPWCPACEASADTIREMSRRWNGSNRDSNRGIKVMVGADSVAKCRQKAAAFGTFAMVDENGDFARQHSVNSYPSWIVFDRNGVEERRIGASFPVPDQSDEVARQVFKL